jgi:hypothetical protein
VYYISYGFCGLGIARISAARAAAASGATAGEPITRQHRLGLVPLERRHHQREPVSSVARLIAVLTGARPALTRYGPSGSGPVWKIGQQICVRHCVVSGVSCRPVR